MALLDIVKKGSTSRSVSLYVFDNTTGLPKTGLVYNSTGIDLWYRRERSAVTSITEVTLAALTTAYASGGFIEVGMGWYSLDVPDAALATGVNYVDVGGTFTGYTVVGGRIRLVDYDPEDTVRMGLTALPNAAAAASGGLPILGANATAISFTAGMTISSAAGSALTLTSSGSNGSGLNATGNGSGSGILTTGGATGHGVNATGGASSGNGIKAASAAGNSGGIRADGNGTGPGIHGVGGATGHGILAAGGATSGNGIKASSSAGNSVGFYATGFGSGAGMRMEGGDTGPGANFVGGATSGNGVVVATTSGNGIDVAATVGHGINVAANGTSKHGILVTGGTAGTSDGLKAVAGTGGVDIRGHLGTVMTESYAAVGQPKTVEQALYEISQQLQWTGTGGGVTQTVYKLDGSTPAYTMTLNNASTPTNVIRAT